MMESPRRFTSARRLRFEPLESRRLLSVTVDTLVDEINGVGVGAGTSLREAIAAAAPDETIDFSVTGTINLSPLGQLTINKNLTISGPGASLLTIKAFDPSAAVGDGTRIFNVDDGNSTADKTVVISGLTLTGGDPGKSGGAIRTVENLTISACTISGNSTSEDSASGGGIYALSSSLTIIASTISGNTTDGEHSFAGGLYSNGGNV